MQRDVFRPDMDDPDLGPPPTILARGSSQKQTLSQRQQQQPLQKSYSQSSMKADPPKPARPSPSKALKKTFSSFLGGGEMTRMSAINTLNEPDTPNARKDHSSFKGMGSRSFSSKSSTGSNGKKTTDDNRIGNDNAMGSRKEPSLTPETVQRTQSAKMNRDFSQSLEMGTASTSAAKEHSRSTNNMLTSNYTQQQQQSQQQQQQQQSPSVSSVFKNAFSSIWHFEKYKDGGSNASDPSSTSKNRKEQEEQERQQQTATAAAGAGGGPKRPSSIQKIGSKRGTSDLREDQGVEGGGKVERNTSQESILSPLSSLALERSSSGKLREQQQQQKSVGLSPGDVLKNAFSSLWKFDSSSPTKDSSGSSSSSALKKDSQRRPQSMPNTQRTSAAANAARQQSIRAASLRFDNNNNIKKKQSVRNKKLGSKWERELAAVVEEHERGESSDLDHDRHMGGHNLKIDDDVGDDDDDDALDDATPSKSPSSRGGGGEDNAQYTTPVTRESARGSNSGGGSGGEFDPAALIASFSDSMYQRSIVDEQFLKEAAAEWDELAALNDSNAAEVERLEAALRRVHVEYAEAAYALKEEVADQLDEQKSLHSAELKRLNGMLDKVVEQHAEELYRCEESAERVLNTLEDAHQRTLSELHDSFYAERESQRRAHEEELREVRTAHEEEVERLQQLLEVADEVIEEQEREAAAATAASNSGSSSSSLMNRHSSAQNILKKVAEKQQEHKRKKEAAAATATATATSSTSTALVQLKKEGDEELNSMIDRFVDDSEDEDEGDEEEEEEEGKDESQDVYVELERLHRLLDTADAVIAHTQENHEAELLRLQQATAATVTSLHAAHRDEVDRLNKLLDRAIVTQHSSGGSGRHIISLPMLLNGLNIETASRNEVMAIDALRYFDVQLEQMRLDYESQLEQGREMREKESQQSKKLWMQLNDEHGLEILSLKAHHKVLLEKLTAENEFLRLEASSNMTSKEAEEEVAAARAAAEEAVHEADKHFEQEAAALKKAHQQQLVQLHADHASALQQARKEAEERAFTAARGEHAAALEIALKEQRTAHAADIDAAVMHAVSEHSEQHLQRALDQQLKQHQSLLDAQQEAMRADRAAAELMLQTALEDQHKLHLVALQNERDAAQANLTLALKELQVRHEEELAAAFEANGVEFAPHSTSTEEEDNGVVDAVALSSTQHLLTSTSTDSPEAEAVTATAVVSKNKMEARWQATVAAAAASSDGAASAAAGARGLHRRISTSLTAAKEKALASHAIEREHAAVKRLQDEHAQELARQRADHDKQLEQHRAELEKHKAELDKHREDMLSKQQQEMDKKREEMAEELKVHQRRFDEALQRARQDVFKYENTVKDTKQEVDEKIRQALKEQKATFAVLMEAAKRDAVEEYKLQNERNMMLAMRQQKLKYAAALEMTRREALLQQKVEDDEKLKSALEQVHKEHLSEVEEYHQKHCDDEAKHTAQVRAMQDYSALARSSSMESLLLISPRKGDAKQAEDRHNQLTSEHVEYVKQISYKAQRLEETNIELEKEIEALKLQLIDEVENARNEERLAHEQLEEAMRLNFIEQIRLEHERELEDKRRTLEMEQEGKLKAMKEFAEAEARAKMRLLLEKHKSEHSESYEADKEAAVLQQQRKAEEMMRAALAARQEEHERELSKVRSQVKRLVEKHRSESLSSQHSEEGAGNYNEEEEEEDIDDNNSGADVTVGSDEDDAQLKQNSDDDQEEDEEEEEEEEEEESGSGGGGGSDASCGEHYSKEDEDEEEEEESGSGGGGGSDASCGEHYSEEDEEEEEEEVNSSYAPVIVTSAARLDIDRHDSFGSDDTGGNDDDDDNGRSGFGSGYATGGGEGGSGSSIKSPSRNKMEARWQESLEISSSQKREATMRRESSVKETDVALVAAMQKAAAKEAIAIAEAAAAAAAAGAGVVLGAAGKPVATQGGAAGGGANAAVAAHTAWDKLRGHAQNEGHKVVSSRKQLKIDINNVLEEHAVSFQKDSTELDAQGEKQLDKILPFLLKNPEAVICVDGHTTCMDIPMTTERKRHLTYHRPSLGQMSCGNGVCRLKQLSQGRTDRVSEYLTRWGAKNRFISTGFGCQFGWDTAHPKKQKAGVRIYQQCDEENDDNGGECDSSSLEDVRLQRKALKGFGVATTTGGSSGSDVSGGT